MCWSVGRLALRFLTVVYNYIMPNICQVLWWWPELTNTEVGNLSLSSSSLDGCFVKGSSSKSGKKFIAGSSALAMTLVDAFRLILLQPNLTRGSIFGFLRQKDSTAIGSRRKRVNQVPVLFRTKILHSIYVLQITAMNPFWNTSFQKGKIRAWSWEQLELE